MKTTGIQKTIHRTITKWAGLGLVLIAAGFLCDGSTEVGHHAFLILGGLAIGFGAAREWSRSGS